MENVKGIAMTKFEPLKKVGYFLRGVLMNTLPAISVIALMLVLAAVQVAVAAGSTP